jgi:hypothetical protein
VFRRTLTTAVAACAVAAALAACGPVKTGAAAIVGNERISDAKLDSAVTEWTKELPHYPEAQQLVQQAQSQQPGQQQEQQSVQPYDPSSPQRSALYLLIQMRTWDELAREQGVTTTPGQVDALVASRGGQSILDTSVVAQGLPTSYTDEFAKMVMIQQVIAQHYGVNPQGATNAQEQAAGQRLLNDIMAAGHKLKITVNPRYGSYDVKSLGLGLVCPHLSTPDSGTPDAPSGDPKCQV